MLPAEHEGSSQRSVKEGEKIQSIYHALLGQAFTEGKKNTRKITKIEFLCSKTD